MMRPTCASVYSEKPAYTSAMRANSRFSSSFERVPRAHAVAGALATSSGIGLSGVSSVPSGMMPFSIIRASTHSRYAS